MNIPAGTSYRVSLEQIAGLGSPWIVRLYKKGFLRDREVSSDWFLDGDQARKFAEQLSSELSRDGSSQNIASRNPGWTLHRPAR